MAVILSNETQLHTLTREVFASGRLVGILEGYNRPNEQGEILLHMSLEPDGFALAVESATAADGHRYFEHAGLSKLCPRDANFMLCVQLTLEDDDIVLQQLEFDTGRLVGKQYRVPLV